MYQIDVEEGGFVTVPGVGGVLDAGRIENSQSAGLVQTWWLGKRILVDLLH